jgi:hypothetical protein
MKMTPLCFGRRRTPILAVSAAVVAALLGLGDWSPARGFVAGCTRQETTDEAQLFATHCAGCHSESKVLDLLRDRNPSDPRAWLTGFLSGHVLCSPDVDRQLADYLAGRVEPEHSR